MTTTCPACGFDNESDAPAAACGRCETPLRAELPAPAKPVRKRRPNSPPADAPPPNKPRNRGMVILVLIGLKLLLFGLIGLKGCGGDRQPGPPFPVPAEVIMRQEKAFELIEPESLGRNAAGLFRYRFKCIRQPDVVLAGEPSLRLTIGAAFVVIPCPVALADAGPAVRTVEFTVPAGRMPRQAQPFTVRLEIPNPRDPLRPRVVSTNLTLWPGAAP